MIQYNLFDLILSNFHLYMFQTEIKIGEVTLKLWSNVSCDSNDEYNFPHNLSFSKIQVSNLREAFANNSSANIKLSKTQWYKTEQSRRFLGRLLWPLLKAGLPNMKNGIKLCFNTIRINSTA